METKMKNKKTGAINRAKKKAAKNVARKNKGAQYGASVRSLSAQQQYGRELVEVMGSTSDEILNEQFVDLNPKGPSVGTIKTGVGSDTRERLNDMFVDDPVGKLNDTLAKANSTAKEIKIS